MGTFTREDHDRLAKDGKLPPVEDDQDEPINAPPEEDLIDDDEPDEQPVDDGEPDEPKEVFDRSKLPPELQDKSPEEVAAYVTNLQNTARQLIGQMQQAQRVPVQQPEPEDVELTNDDLLDADSLSTKLDRMLATKTAPYVGQLLQMRATQNYQQAFRDHDFLGDYRDEFNQAVAQLTNEAMANPATVQIVANGILRRHFDEIAQKRTSARAKPTPPQSPRGDSVGTPSGKGSGGGLTPEEKRVAKALGVTYEAYREMKKAMNG